MIKLKHVKENEFPALISQSIKGFADECVEAGRWPANEAIDYATTIIKADLPEGLNTANNWFFHLYSIEEKETVGYIWLETMKKDNLPTLFIADFEIKAQHRCQGHAVASLQAIEAFAKEQNINRICLHVFRNNKAAQALYNKMGFQVTGFNMLKNL